MRLYMTTLQRVKIFYGLFLILSILVTTVQAGFSPSAEYVNPFNDFMKSEGGVDLLSGNASFAKTIFTMQGRNGMDVNLTLRYSSNIGANAYSNNGVAPTGWVGLGWEFGFGKIISDHNNTAALSDDIYYWESPEGLQERIYEKKTGANKGTFYLEKHPFWKVKRVVDPAHDDIILGWILTDTDGKKHKYGNLVKDSDGSYVDSKATRYDFSSRKSDDGGSTYYGYSVGQLCGEYSADEFAPYPVTWDLAQIEDHHGNAINFTYTQILEKISEFTVEGEYKSYTKASYLNTITNPEGKKIEFVLADKRSNEYWDENRIIAEDAEKGTFDAYKEYFETKYLKNIIVSNEHQDIQKQYKFCYLFLNDDADFIGSRRYGYQKRLLTSIDEWNETKKLSGMSFTYYDDPDSISGKDVAPNPNYNYGALKSFRSSSCGVTEFVYKRKYSDNLNSYRDTHIDGFFSVNQTGTTSDGRSYIITTGHPRSNNNDDLYIFTEKLDGTGFLHQHFNGVHANIIKSNQDLVACINGPSANSFHWNGNQWIQVWNNEQIGQTGGNVQDISVGDGFIVYSDKVNDDIDVYNFDEENFRWVKTISNENFGISNLGNIGTKIQGNSIVIAEFKNRFIAKDHFKLWILIWNETTQSWEQSKNVWEKLDHVYGDGGEFISGTNFFVTIGGYMGETVHIYEWDGRDWNQTHSTGESYGNNRMKKVIAGKDYIVIAGQQMQRTTYALNRKSYGQWENRNIDSYDWTGSKDENELVGGDNFFVKVAGRRGSRRWIKNWDGKEWFTSAGGYDTRHNGSKREIDQILTGNNKVALTYGRVAPREQNSGNELDKGCIVDLELGNGEYWTRPLNQYKNWLGSRVALDYHNWQFLFIKGTNWHRREKKVHFLKGDFILIEYVIDNAHNKYFYYYLNRSGEGRPFGYVVDKKILHDGTGDSSVTKFDYFAHYLPGQVRPDGTTVNVEEYSNKQLNFNIKTKTLFANKTTVTTGSSVTEHFHNTPSDYKDNYEEEWYGATDSLKTVAEKIENEYAVLENAEWPNGVKTVKQTAANKIFDAAKYFREQFTYNSTNGLVETTVDGIVEADVFTPRKKETLTYAHEATDGAGGLLYPEMTTENLLAKPYLSEVHDLSGGTPTLFSALRNTWAKSLYNTWVPSETQTWVEGETWDTKATYAIFDSHGLPLTVKDGENVPTATLFGWNSSRPIAQILNAVSTECGIYTCDYSEDMLSEGEDEGSGEDTPESVSPEFFLDEDNEWIGHYGCEVVSIKTELNKSGKFTDNVLRLKGGSVSKKVTLSDDNRNYIVSFWHKANTANNYGKGVISINGLVAANSTVIKEIAFEGGEEWQKIEVLLPAKEINTFDGLEISIATAGLTADKVLDGGGSLSLLYLTDIRIHPDDALVTTSYYHPKWQTEIAKVDPNGSCNLAVLDEFGRPVKWLNNKRELVKENAYTLMNCFEDNNTNTLEDMSTRSAKGQGIDFDPENEEYVLTVPDATTEVGVFAKAENREAFISIDDDNTDCPCSRDVTIPLRDEDMVNGGRIVDIAVIPPAKNIKNYNLRIYKLSTCWQYLSSLATVSDNTAVNYTDMNYDSNNGLHVVYRTSTNNEIYIKEYDPENEVWTLLTDSPLQTESAGYVSLEYPYIFYVEDKEISYTENSETYTKTVPVLSGQVFNGGEWSNITATSEISEILESPVSTILDNSDRPHVAYVTEGASEDERIVTVKFFDNTDWITLASEISLDGELQGFQLTKNSTGILLSYAMVNESNDESVHEIYVKQASGSSWDDYAALTVNENVVAYDITVVNDELYLALRSLSGVTVKKYNGTAWDTLGDDIAIPFVGTSSNENFQLFNKNGTLYALFTSQYNSRKLTAIKWDGTNWVSEGNPAFSEMPLEAGSEINLVTDHLGRRMTSLVNPAYQKQASVMYFNSDCPDATLKTLEIQTPSGVSLTPDFKPYILSYNTDIDNEYALVEVKVETNDPAAYKVLVDGKIPVNDVVRVNLEVGENEIPVTVVGNDEKTRLTYYLNVKRLPSSYAALCNVALSDDEGNVITFSQKDDPANSSFHANVSEYVANVGLALDKLVFTIHNEGSAQVLVAGEQVSTSKVVDLQYGENNIEIVAIAADGVSTRSYLFTITRDVDDRLFMDDLTLNNVTGVFNPTFNKNTFGYKVLLDETESSISFSPTTYNQNAVVYCNEQEIVNSTTEEYDLKYGTNAFSFVVTHPEIEDKVLSYFVEVIRTPSNDISLSDLVIANTATSSTIAFEPSVAVNKMEYYTTVSDETEEIELDVVTTDATSKVIISEDEPVVISNNTNIFLDEITIQNGVMTSQFSATQFVYGYMVNPGMTDISLTVSGNYDNVLFNGEEGTTICELNGVIVDCETVNESSLLPDDIYKKYHQSPSFDTEVDFIKIELQKDGENSPTIYTLRRDDNPVASDNIFSLNKGDNTYSVQIFSADYSKEVQYHVTIDRELAPIPDPNISFKRGSSKVNENRNTMVDVALSLSSLPVAAVTVDYSVISATPPAVPATVTGPESDVLLSAGTLTFEPCEQEQIISFNIVNDERVEEDESFIIRIDNVINAQVKGSREHEVLIIDDDQIPVTITTTGDIKVLEGNTSNTTVEIDVQLAEPFTKDLTLSYSTGWQHPGITRRDFSFENKQVTFAAGETEKTIEVTIVGDEWYEADEWFDVKLTPFGKLKKGDPYYKRITILNDDEQPSYASFTMSNGESDEFDSGPVTVSVVLDKASNSPITVPFTLAGMAIEGDTPEDDYTITDPIGNALFFAAGETQQSIEFMIKDDKVHEGNEYIHFTLGNPESSSPVFINDTKKKYVHKIIDDDTKVVDSGISNVIYVNNALATGNNTGNSWNNAFRNLQDGLDAAANWKPYNPWDNVVIHQEGMLSSQFDDEVIEKSLKIYNNGTEEIDLQNYSFDYYIHESGVSATYDGMVYYFNDGTSADDMTSAAKMTIDSVVDHTSSQWLDQTKPNHRIRLTITDSHKIPAKGYATLEFGVWGRPDFDQNNDWSSINTYGVPEISERIVVLNGMGDHVKGEIPPITGEINLTVEHKRTENPAESGCMVGPSIKIVNNGADPIPLNELVVDYYYYHPDFESYSMYPPRIADYPWYFNPGGNGNDNTADLSLETKMLYEVTDKFEISGKKADIVTSASLSGNYAIPVGEEATIEFGAIPINSRSGAEICGLEQQNDWSFNSADFDTHKENLYIVVRTKAGERIWGSAPTDLKFQETPEVWVAKGNGYKPGDMNGFSIPDGVRIYGGFVGSSDEVSTSDRIAGSKTSVSGDLNSNQLFDGSDATILFNSSNTNNDIVIDGFQFSDCYTSFNYSAPVSFNTPDVSTTNVSVIIRNVDFSNNKRGEFRIFKAGGIFWKSMNNAGSRLMLENVTFDSNILNSSSPVYNSPLIRGDIETVRLVNCVMTNNKGNLEGNLEGSYDAMIFLDDNEYESNVELVNTSVVNNYSSKVTANNVVVKNSIFWNNEMHDFSGATMSNSFASAAGSGNIYDVAGPRFSTFPAEPTTVDELTLHETSPCINSGDNSAVPVGVTSDIIGNDRIQQGAVDMGAFETPYEKTTMLLTLNHGTYHGQGVFEATVTPFGTYTVEGGDEFSITAAVSEGYDFTGWVVAAGSGVTFGDQNSISTTVTLSGSDATVYPSTERKQYTLTILDPAAGGTSNPSGTFQVYHDGGKVDGTNMTLQVNLEGGYALTGWEVVSGTGVTFTDATNNSGFNQAKLTDGDATIRPVLNNSGLHNDSLALVAFKQAQPDQSWFENANGWECISNGTPINQWTGVTINSNRVSGLNVNDANVEDISHLSNLTQMVSLFLQRNNISNLTPLSDLTMLEYISIGSNNIGDLSPLNSLIKLRILSLGRNNITDLTPLSNLVNLTNLSLDENSIVDLTPLTNLVLLESVHISMNDIENVPDDIDRLTNLINFSIRENQICAPVSSRVEQFLVNNVGPDWQSKQNCQ